VKALDRKLLREVRGHLGMLLAVTGIIAVGVGCMVTLASAYLNLSEAKTLYYAQCRMADFSIELKKVPLSELLRLAALPEVAEIRPRIQQIVTVDLDGVSEPLNGQVLSLPDARQSMINDIVIRQGSYFTDRRANEVIVNEAFAGYHRLRPGQWIRLLMNNQQQELFVVGTAISSEFVYLLGAGSITPDPKRFGVFYIKQSFAEESFDFKGSANQVLGRLSAAAHGSPREVLRRAEQMLEPYGVFTTTPLEEQMSNKFLSQEIQGVRSFAVISPCMFLGVAALVLNVLLSRLAQQQRMVIGTLKALGYSDLQVSWHFLKFGLMVGVSGALVGCAAGYWMATGMTAMYHQFFQFPALESRLRWNLFALGTAVSLTCAAVGSLYGSRSVLRLRPAEAMRPAQPRSGGRVFLERIGWLWGSLTSAWRMVLRNLLRARVRTLASIFAAAMGGSVMVNGFMMQEAMKYMIDFQFRKIMRNDLELSFKDERGVEAVEEAARLPGVDYTEPTLSVACKFTHGSHEKKGSVTGLVPHARLTVPRDLASRPIRIPTHGLAMSRRMAETLHVARGDLVGVEPIKGDRRLQYVPVEAIADSYLGMYVYADIHYLSHLVGEELATSGVQLATDHNARHRDALLHELKQLPALQSVTARADMIATLEDTIIKNQTVIINLFVVFTGIVFFGSILNGSLVSLAERQRELATLRVLGYSPYEVGRLLLRESLITTILGALLGMPLGYALTMTIAASYASDLFRLPLVAPMGMWTKTLLLAIAFGLLTHIVVQKQVNTMDWLDALKTKE
jgi:putative ABC transport system permease protein